MAVHDLPVPSSLHSRAEAERLPPGEELQHHHREAVHVAFAGKLYTFPGQASSPGDLGLVDGREPWRAEVGHVVRVSSPYVEQYVCRLELAVQDRRRGG